MMTRPRNLYPLVLHFYIETGVNRGLHIFVLKHRSWVLVTPLMGTPSMRRFYREITIYVLSKSMKISQFFIRKLKFYSSILHGRVYKHDARFIQRKQLSLFCILELSALG